MDPQDRSVLKPDAEFTGPVHVVSPARLDGRIEGEITAVAPLWIGPTAIIRASVQAEEVIIEGHLEGELHATHRIELRATAHVTADIFTPRLSLQEGAILQGRCLTIRPEDT